VKSITTNEQNDLSPGIVISNGLRWQDGEIASTYTVPLRLNRFLASLRNDSVGNLSPRMPTKAAEKLVKAIATNEQNDLSPGIVISNGLRQQDGVIASTYTVPLRLNRFLASLRNDIVGNLSPRMPMKATERSVRPGITIHTRPAEPISRSASK